MRYCSKTACGREAMASYAFSYETRTVWLSALTLEPHPAFYDLCDRHAEMLRVPNGWVMEDLRSEKEPDTSLPEVPAVTPEPPPEPVKPPAAGATDVVPPPSEAQADHPGSHSGEAEADPPDAPRDATAPQVAASQPTLIA